ncbi:MAG: hypothetical protein ACE5J7_02215 [Candidatus Aenigmatarchaeota archaeon]
MAILPEVVNAQTIAIFLVFIIVVFVLYKLFKLAIRAAIAGAAGLAFPWVVDYLSLPLPIVPSLEASMQFALLAVALLLAYEFFHFIVFIVKVIAFPFKLIFGKGDKKEIKRLRKEVKEVEKEKRKR